MHISIFVLMRFTRLIILVLVVSTATLEKVSCSPFQIEGTDKIAFFNQQQSAPKVIRVGEYSDKLQMSEVLDIQKIVPLETTAESLIGEIRKIKVFKDHIYVLDAFKSKKLAVFDMQGKHIRNIGTNGDGPGEYKDMQDFTINTDNNDIIILDKWLNILTYSSDGQFIKRASPRMPADCIAYLGDGLIAIYSEKGSQSMSHGKHKLRIYDLGQLKVISKHIKIDFSLENKIMGRQTNFAEFEDVLSIYSSAHDTIMQIKNGIIESKYVVKHKKKPRPVDYFRNSPDIPEGYVKLVQSGYPTPASNWIETKNYIHFTYIRDNNIYTNFYSKSSSELIVSTKSMIDETSMAILPSPIGNTDDQFIFKVEPEYVAMIRAYNEKNNRTSKYPERFKAMFEAIEGDENPLIVFTKLKEKQ